MTAASFFRDLASFSLQIAIVVLVVTALLKVVRVPARARYVCLRLTLLACLVVPWTLRSSVVVTHAPEGATRAAVNSLTTSGQAAAGMPLAAPSSPATAGPKVLPDVAWTTVGLFTLIVGVAARAVWLAIGFLRLGRLTRRAVPVESAEYALVQEQLGTSATISEVDRLAQPVTFGFRRPTVLLPDVLAVAPAPLRRAVVTHELFHVRRGDWLSLLGEEAVRTVLWFHPAIHWLTSSIQLAREEMVDELTVRATGDRRAYMQALLAFADTGGLRVAPAFAHRRHLFHRILRVSKERVMSAPRIVTSVAALAIGVSAAIWYASSAFPILTASRVELPAVGTPLIDDDWLIAEQSVTVAAARQRGAVSGDRDEPNEVTPENPIPRRTRGASPAWPSQFAGRQVEVVVTTLVRIGRDGAVTNVVDMGCSVRSGDAACGPFFDAAAAAIRQWRYDRPVRGPLEFSIAVTFRPGAEAVVVQSPSSFVQQGLVSADGGSVDASEWARYVRETQESLRLLAQQTDRVAIVNQRDFERGLRAIEEQASADTMRQQLEELRNGLRELERALRLTLERGPDSGDLARYRERLAAMNDELASLQRALASTRERSSELAESAARLAQAEEALRANQRPLVSPSGKTPIRVADTPGVQPPTVTRKVDPQHPIVAMQARVSGTVVLEVLVDERGNVADARVARSIPLLDQAALDAVKQWQFRPATLKGEAVPVIVQVEMNFTLK
jgi:TonB family protein